MDPLFPSEKEEDVTTIFCVGFPDDFTEREFVSMFIFAPGFEAATLKYPSQTDSPDEAAPFYKKTTIGFAKFRSRSEANYARDFLNGRRVDSHGDYRVCILKAEIAKKNLHVKPAPPIPTLSSPSSYLASISPSEFLLHAQHQQHSKFHTNYTTPTSTLLNGLSQNVSPVLMQITSPPASVASPSSNAAAAAAVSSLVGGSGDFSGALQSPVPWDLLNGDEVEEKGAEKEDVQTGSRIGCMKALSGGGDFGGRASVSRLRIHINEAALEAAAPAAFGSGYSSATTTLCRNSPTTGDGEGEGDGVDAVVDVLDSSSRVHGVCGVIDGSLQEKEWGNIRSSVTATAFGRMVGNSGPSTQSGAGDRGFSSALFSSDSLWNVEAASGRNVASLSMNVGGFGAGISAGGLGGLSSAGGYGRVPAAPSTGAMYSSAAVGAGNGGGLGVLYSPYLPLGNGMHPALVANGGAFQVNLPTPASIAAAGYRCPADQNPPCNTLYVGNLPSNTSEVELRDVFARCLGYRRMSFRMRPNGPMVFVEFESIPCAQQALNDLHGTLLSNSIKGGIRLSFSKNPLGVRLNHASSHPHLNIGSVGGMGSGGWNTLPSPSLLTPISGLFGNGEMVM